MLGQDLIARLKDDHEDVTATDRDEVDITNPTAVRSIVTAIRPDVVVNCAAWTAVDDAEEHEADAFRLNALGPATLASATAAVSARLVQVSTDYVFDGMAEEPYSEASALAPRTAYGRTKAAGEWAVRALSNRHYIVRTAYLYGAGGQCFPKTIARAGRSRDRLDVVADQVGQPTWTVDVAGIIVALVTADAPTGIYHATSSGSASWFDFAKAVVAADGQDVEKVSATTSELFVRSAPRPSYSVLGHDALVACGITPIGPWQERWRKASSTVLAD